MNKTAVTSLWLHPKNIVDKTLETSQHKFNMIYLTVLAKTYTIFQIIQKFDTHGFLRY